MKSIILAAVLTAAPVAVSAQAIPAPGGGPRCYPHEDMVRWLDENYGESSQSYGLNDYGLVVETFANAESGSWSLVITDATGLSCIQDAGDSFVRSNQPDGEPA